MTSILSSLKLRGALLLLTAFAGTASSEAASIRYDVKVVGYSSAGWIKVVPELRSLLGGRVAYLPQYGGWVTDRAARGEPIRTTISPNRAPERQGTQVFVGLRVNGRDVIQPFPATLTYSNVRQVSTDASVDNISVWTTTPAGYFETRVPVGSRPHHP